MREQAEGVDTALARVLERDRSLNPALLQSCLGEVRQRRWSDPDLSLAVLLLERRLVTADRLERALSEIVEVGPTVYESRAHGLDSSADRAPAAFGPYRVVRELARGGMGIVFEVEHAESGVRYALKTVIGGQLVAEVLLEERERFGREAELTARLDHPHIVRVHGAHLGGNWPYLVQDLLPGGSLHERLRVGPLPLGEALEITLSLGQALKHAHARQVIHRDLKPQNVLFDDRGEPRLVDFGLARSVRATSLRLTATGTIMGTPGYMAPEQARGEKEVGPAADVYSLAALLFAMLTGDAPFPGQQVFQVLDAVLHDPPPALRTKRADLPPRTGAALQRLLQRAMAKDPLQRPGLDELLDGLRALGRGDASGLLRRRQAWPLIAAGLLLGVVLVGVGVFLLKQRHDQREARRTWETYRAWEADTLRAFRLGLVPGQALALEAVQTRIARLESARASLPRKARAELDASLLVLRAHVRLLRGQAGEGGAPVDQLVDAVLLRTEQPTRALQLVSRVLGKGEGVGADVLLPAHLLQLQLVAGDRVNLLRIARHTLPAEARPLAFELLATHYREAAARLPLTRDPAAVLVELEQLREALAPLGGARLPRLKRALLEEQASAWREPLLEAVRASRELRLIQRLGDWVRQTPRTSLGPQLKAVLRQVEEQILADYEHRSSGADYLPNQRLLLRALKVDQAIYYGLDPSWVWSPKLSLPARTAHLARGNSPQELIDVVSLASLRGGGERSLVRLIQFPDAKALARFGQQNPRSRLFLVATFLRGTPRPVRETSADAHVKYAEQLARTCDGDALEDLAPQYQAELCYLVGAALGDAKAQVFEGGDPARARALARRVIPWTRKARRLGLSYRKLEHCGYHESSAYEHLGDYRAAERVWREIVPKLRAWTRAAVKQLGRASAEPLALARSLFHSARVQRMLKRPEEAAKRAEEGLRVLKTQMHQPNRGAEIQLRTLISEIRLEQGHGKQALAALRPLLPRAVQEGQHFAEHSVRVLRHVKRLDEARDLLRRCRETWPSSVYLRQARQELLGSK